VFGASPVSSTSCSVVRAASVADDDHAPADAADWIDRVGLEGDNGASAVHGGGDRGARASLEDDALAVDDVVDRPDRRKCAVGEDHPAERHGAEEPQRLLAGQLPLLPGAGHRSAPSALSGTSAERRRGVAAAVCAWPSCSRAAIKSCGIGTSWRP
jgi:hypothetical protein